MLASDSEGGVGHCYTEGCKVAEDLASATIFPNLPMEGSSGGASVGVVGEKAMSERVGPKLA